MNKLNLIDFKGEDLDKLCERIAQSFGYNVPPVISVSAKNNKMGEIPSISLPPVITCRKNAPCIKDCYACKHGYNLYTNTMNAYNRNLFNLVVDPNLYYTTLDFELMRNSFFRLHVSGDFINYEHFSTCCEIIKKHPNCQVLVFTKQFEIVNEYMNKNEKPSNLHLFLSNWGKWVCENPHNLPTTNVLNKGEELPTGYKLCGGNCYNCACRGLGCWTAENGDKIAFYKH